MALFHLSVTQTKRSAGQSAIASAAYQFPVLPMPKTHLPFFSFVLSFSFVSYFTLIAVVFENAP